MIYHNLENVSQNLIRVFVLDPREWVFFFAAVDAELTSTGVVQFSGDLEHLVHVENKAHSHSRIIAVGELEAIRRAIDLATSQQQQSQYNILIIATDNLVAKRWVEKRVADNDDANEILRHIFQVMVDHGFHISLLYVPSADNAADPISRGRYERNDDQFRRNAATRALLQQERANWLLQRNSNSDRCQTTQRRSDTAVEDERSRAGRCLMWEGEDWEEYS